MRIVPLGTNGYFPALKRQTASYLALSDRGAFMLDAGTGVGRLGEPEIASLLAPYHRLNIFLSHYHLDHCGGLAYLAGVWDRPVRVYAPAPPHCEFTPEDALGTLHNAPFSTPIKRFPFDVTIVPVSGLSMEVEDTVFRFRSQTHWCGSMGIRIGDEVAYVTDTIVDQETTGFVDGVKLLLHEVWMTDEEAAVDDVGRRDHSYARGVAEIARSAAVGKVMMIHHKPQRLVDEIETMRTSMESIAEREVIAPVEGRIYNT